MPYTVTLRDQAMQHWRAHFDTQTPRVLARILMCNLLNPHTVLYCLRTGYTATPQDKADLAEHCRTLAYTEKAG